MKPYPEYKDSSVEWIGEIPVHWGMNRLKYFSKVFSSSVDRHIHEDENQVYICHYPDVYNNEFILCKEGLNIGSCSDVEIAIFKLRKGQVILTKDSESPDDIGNPCYIEKDYDDVVCGYHLSIIEVKDDIVNSKFLFRFIQSDKVKCYFEVYSKGITRFSLGKSKIENLFVNLPSKSEQIQIVSFLDRKTQKIDALIEQTKRKIALLKEYRSSLINHCVTKGLHPNAEMKNSGVEWIGEIPKHWDTAKIYQYTTLITGGTPSKDKKEYWENGEIPWMSSGEIHKRIIKNIDGRITELGKQNSNASLIPIDTVMIGLNGQGRTKGTVGILKIETTCNQSLCGFICKNSINPMYLYYYLDSQYKTIRGFVGEGKREGLSMSFLKLYPVLLISNIEQKQIVEYLDQQTQKIDSTIEKEQKRIELLKEYRQSLISEVVTGKIDVRDNEAAA